MTTSSEVDTPDFIMKYGEDLDISNLPDENRNDEYFAFYLACQGTSGKMQPLTMTSYHWSGNRDISISFISDPLPNTYDTNFTILPQKIILPYKTKKTL